MSQSVWLVLRSAAAHALTRHYHYHPVLRTYFDANTTHEVVERLLTLIMLSSWKVDGKIPSYLYLKIVQIDCQDPSKLLGSRTSHSCCDVRALHSNPLFLISTLHFDQLQGLTGQTEKSLMITPYIISTYGEEKEPGSPSRWRNGVDLGLARRLVRCGGVVH
ncbi:hypothetical protein BR93DRAFT_697288 [Coniochaeta sp. PMI_546]|nr:hypothetical protein BR93DRAFT_697288 [Coniochaeta sp. PMI_546]